MKGKIEATAKIVVIVIAGVLGSVFLKDRLFPLPQNEKQLKPGISYRTWTVELASALKDCCIGPSDAGLARMSVLCRAEATQQAAVPVSRARRIPRPRKMNE